LELGLGLDLAHLQLVTGNGLWCGVGMHCTDCPLDLAVVTVSQEFELKEIDFKPFFYLADDKTTID